MATTEESSSITATPAATTTGASPRIGGDTESAEPGRLSPVTRRRADYILGSKADDLGIESVQLWSLDREES